MPKPSVTAAGPSASLVRPYLYASAASPNAELSRAFDEMDRPTRQQALGGDAGCALALQLSALVMARDKPQDIRALRRVLADDVMPQASSSERIKLNAALGRMSRQQQAIQAGLGRMPAACWDLVCNDVMSANIFVELYKLSRAQADELVNRNLVSLTEPKVVSLLTHHEAYAFLSSGVLSWADALPNLGPLDVDATWALVQAQRCLGSDILPWLVSREDGGLLPCQQSRIELADRLMAHGMLSRDVYRDILCRDSAATLRLIEIGRVDFGRAAGQLPTLSIADVRRVVSAGRGSFAQWACVARLPQALLQDGVGQGVFCKADLLLPGHNRYRLSLALWTWGRIDDKTARHHLLSHWTPEYDIPQVIAEQVLLYPDERALLDGCPMPRSPKAAYRFAYMWRCLAIWWTETNAASIPLEVPGMRPAPVAPQPLRPTIAPEPMRPDAVAAAMPQERALQVDVAQHSAWLDWAFFGPLRLWSPVIPAWLWPQSARHHSIATVPEVSAAPAPVTNPVPIVEPLPQCLACMEPMEAQALALPLPDCRHAVQLCGDCFTRGLQAEASQRCPDPGCHRLLNLRDGQLLEWSADRMDSTAMRLVRRARESSPALWSCPTDDCPGGLSSSDKAPPLFTCRFCASSVSMSEEARMRRALTPEDLQQVDLLLASALDAIGTTGTTGGAFTGVIRECYHCGVPTRHDGGCSHMRCSACYRDWDFVYGPARQHNYRMDVQQYVPQRSWLVRLGLYDGLSAGTTSASVTAILAANVAKLRRDR